MSKSSITVHGTCVALGAGAALLRGAPGAGKSDLALRFLEMYERDSAALVSDDQTRLKADGCGLAASAPAPIKGRLEVRGVGIVDVATVPQAELMLLVDLVEPEDVERLPADPLPRETILGKRLPFLKLAPFEVSAPIKLKLALERAM